MQSRSLRRSEHQHNKSLTVQLGDTYFGSPRLNSESARSGPRQFPFVGHFGLATTSFSGPLPLPARFFHLFTFSFFLFTLFPFSPLAASHSRYSYIPGRYLDLTTTNNGTLSLRLRLVALSELPFPADSFEDRSPFPSRFILNSANPLTGSLPGSRSKPLPTRYQFPRGRCLMPATYSFSSRRFC